jgi:hypothetical protein
MPRGPRGERRPAETVQCAHRVFQIAIGEIEEKLPSGRRRSGVAGGHARAGKLSSESRREIAKKAAAGRWK